MEELQIDKKSFNFIVTQEVTSPAYYEKHYRRPEWPGESSGITIGCGYDLGYASPDKIRADWSKHVSPAMLSVMVACSGVTGSRAAALLPSVKNAIDIPWDAALDVFQNTDIPQWTARVRRAIPNTDKISSRCLGMLVSTAYNRGIAGFTSSPDKDRFRELRNIRAHMAAQNFNKIGAEFRSMQRIWPNSKGLRTRYAQTADIWDEGLLLPAIGKTALPPLSADSAPMKTGPARTKPSAMTPAQHGAAGAIVAGGAAGAKAAAAHGASTSMIIAIVVFSAVVAATVWLAWYKNRNPK